MAFEQLGPEEYNFSHLMASKVSIPIDHQSTSAVLYLHYFRGILLVLVGDISQLEIGSVSSYPTVVDFHYYAYQMTVPRVSVIMRADCNMDWLTALSATMIKFLPLQFFGLSHIIPGKIKNAVYCF